MIRLTGKFACLWVILFFAQKASSQTASDPITEMIYSRPHWEIFLLPNINQRAQLTHQAGATYRLESEPQLSGEIGINRFLHITHRMSMGFGLHFGLAGRNASYQTPYREVGFDLNETYYFKGGITQAYDMPYLSVPVFVEYRWFRPNLDAFYAQAGINLRISKTGSSTIQDMTIMTVNLEENSRVILNLQAAGGYQWKLKNMNYLKVALALNYDPSNLGKGDFSLITKSSRDFGSYIVKGTNLGLHMGYVFTRARKRITQVNTLKPF